jgi:thiol:disulfide interchange protein DsbC
MKRVVFIDGALRVVLGLSLAFFGYTAKAESPSPEIRAVIEQKIAAMAPGLTVNEIAPAPIENLLEVTLGSRVVYFTADGKHLLLGEILDADTGQNLTELRRAELTAEKLKIYDNDQMIVIGPENPTRYVTVFTDVDCPYCAKFHRDVPALNEAGVQVRYLLFPRSGLQGRSYERAVGVWCADDRIESVGIAKAGGEVEYRDCQNPVEGHYTLGQDVGIRGTPAIILDDGRMIAGYIPPEQLLAQLGIKAEAE